MRRLRTVRREEVALGGISQAHCGHCAGCTKSATPAANQGGSSAHRPRCRRSAQGATTPRPSRGPVERVALVVRVHLGEVLTVSGTQDVPAPLLAKGRAVEPRLSRETRRASSTCPRTTSLRRPRALFGPSSIMRGPSVRRAAASTVRARVHGARASSHNPAGPTRAPEPRRAAGSRKHPSAPAPERSGRGELSLHARPRITREPQGSSKRAARHRSIRAAARGSSAAITLRAPRTAC
jgi:hypothetical protein